MIKVLGFFIGFGDLDEANWRPRIDAVLSASLPGALTRLVRGLSGPHASLGFEGIELPHVWVFLVGQERQGQQESCCPTKGLWRLCCSLYRTESSGAPCPVV